VDNRTTGAKIKESASGVKGLVAAVHGAGEALRGNFNKEVDRAFGDVCAPSFPRFPHLGVLGEFSLEGGRFWEAGGGGRRRGR
jgi:hypothetical protein